MRLTRVLALVSLTAGFHETKARTLVSSPGQIAAIPSWDLQSSAGIGPDLNIVSRPGFGTGSWHHVKISKCTLMGCLVEAGVYNETDLFYSDNLRKVDAQQFSVPWIYRSEFSLEPGPGKHFFLYTHGISSRADIFLNGHQVASASEQAGSFAGKTYDVTKLVSRQNALAIRAYPTDYYRDLALGWVDWNPWPADNGTGVWRDVEIKQTGAVQLEQLRVVTRLGPRLGNEPAKVTLKARAHNLEDFTIRVTAIGVVSGPNHRPVVRTHTFTLPPRSVTDILLDTVVEKPAIWWPRQWGGQPLYSAKLTVMTADGGLSDFTEAEFGFRTVTSTLNAHNDTTFHINGHPFQVIGAGYAPDIFLRWSLPKWETTLRYILDLGFNTVRLEGKNEHPSLYRLANRLGVMIMPGWECCDKWEAWPYNTDLPFPTVPVWSDADYAIAHASMLHETAMLQSHPSVLTYLIGSDYWPDEHATSLYLSAFHSLDWQLPITDSASKRGFSPQTGPSGMKMDGPYDWVPPNYWFDTVPASSRYGAAFGFGSELSAGVGTPELSSLRKFLPPVDLADLWRAPNKSLFHMSREGSKFETREIYNAALWNRWGAPSSLEDYVMKAQLMDYEATRAQVDGYVAMWSEKSRPATGMVYWMGNNAWPGLHWQLWDWYGRGMGAYYGAKMGREAVVWDSVRKAVWIVNRSLIEMGRRRVEVDIVGLDGRIVYEGKVEVRTEGNRSQRVVELGEVFQNVTTMVFLRLVLRDEKGIVLSRRVYWVAKEVDVLDWERSEWYYTPVSNYVDYTALNRLSPANVSVLAVNRGKSEVSVTLENQSEVPAFFISLNLLDAEGSDILPVTWEDNYVTLWPKEKLTLTARAVGFGKWDAVSVQVIGKNVAQVIVKVARKR
ncbi:hypothetical protein VTI74DRAFT_3136 [Chaetomium olivicolor]